jgi:hypothetical protein
MKSGRKLSKKIDNPREERNFANRAASLGLGFLSRIYAPRNRNDAALQIEIAKAQRCRFAVPHSHPEEKIEPSIPVWFVMPKPNEDAITLFNFERIRFWPFDSRPVQFRKRSNQAFALDVPPERAKMPVDDISTTGALPQQICAKGLEDEIWLSPENRWLQVPGAGLHRNKNGAS